MADKVPDSGSAPTAQVLFVEDSAAEIRLVTELLNRARVQFDGHWVTSGEDALRFLKREAGFETAPRPDLIFLDLNLPMMGGDSTLNRIQASDELKPIPVVILSGSDHEDDVVAAREKGAVHYLVKPLNYEKLCEAVARIRSLKIEPRGEDLFLCAEV